jgi:hypothetical protein
MDRDEDTIPNVVVYDDYENKRIKAIDGFMVAPRSKKEALRAQYDLYPTKELRQLNMKEDRKKLKAYFRKYPNPASWKDNSFDDFEIEETTFNRIRREYIEGPLKLAGFKIYSKNDNTGQLTAAHYMTIIQKIMGRVMEVAYLVVFPSLSTDYDFKNDRFKVKTKKRKERVEERLEQGIIQGDIERLQKIYPQSQILKDLKQGATSLEAVITITVLYFYLANNGEAHKTLPNGKTVVNSEIFDLIDEINERKGYDVIEVEDKRLKVGAQYEYVITDHDRPDLDTRVKPAKYYPTATARPPKATSRWTVMPGIEPKYNPSSMYSRPLGKDVPVDWKHMVESMSGESLEDYQSGLKRRRVDVEEEEGPTSSSGVRTRKTKSKK